MKRTIAVLLSLACAACSPAVTKVNVPDIAKSNVISVLDARPASEKERKVFSFFVPNEAYGILREGDVRLSPSPVILLQHQVFEKFNTAGHFPEVDVHHFVIYENEKHQLKAGAAAVAAGGLIGALIANAITSHDVTLQTKVIDEATFDSSGSDEYQRALFSSEENPKEGAVYIVYIDTDINGKRVFTRTIAPMKKKGDENSLVRAVDFAIDHHLDNYGVGAQAAATNAADTAIPVTAAPKTTEAVTVEPFAASSSSPASSLSSSVTPDSAAVASTSSQKAVGSKAAPVEATPVSPASIPVATTMPFTTASLQESAATAAIEPNAQSIATQLGCGAVQANGATTFVAPCGSYSVLIDCDSGQCRPMHTLNVKHDE